MNAKTTHTAEVVPGEKSQFDVLADGKLIFSKQRVGRFPEPEEMVTALS